MIAIPPTDNDEKSIADAIAEIAEILDSQPVPTEGRCITMPRSAWLRYLKDTLGWRRFTMRFYWTLKLMRKSS